MASGTIYGITSNQYIDSKIVWSSVADHSANKSTVTAELYYKRNNTGHHTYGTGTYTLSIDGQTQTNTSFISIKDSWYIAVSATKTISHNADGTKTITISATGSIPGTTLESTSCSGIVNLDTIPIASTISKAKDVYYGDDFEITWTPLSAKHYYKIVFTAGSWSRTTAILYPNTTSAYTYKGLGTNSEFAKAFPNQNSVDVTATLYTYSDYGTTQVGDISPKTFVVTYSNQYLNPTAGLTLEPDTPYEKFSSLYIQGLSMVKATAWAQGVDGASITSQIVQIQGRNYPLACEAMVKYTCTSDIIQQSGSLTVTSTVKDSRRITRTISKSINVIPYGKPYILPASDESAIICARCDEDGNLSNSGEYLKIKAERSYFTVTSEGVQNNFCEIRYRYRKETDTDFSDWITILDKSKIDTDTIDSDPIPGVVSSTATAYVVQVGVIDDIGNTDASQFNIPTDFVVLDIPENQRGKRIGIFRYAADPTDEYNHIDIDGYIHGGGVDSLTLGTMLTASADAHLNLDSIVTPGCYYSPDMVTTQYISNTPTGVDFGFGLEVRQMQGVENVRQTLYYGITTWYRHRNKEEWSDWVSSLTGVSDSVIAQDFVVDTGTSGLWNYRLWNSGYAELWGVITLDTFGDARHIYKIAGLPFPFTEYPTVTMTISQAAAYSYRQGAIVLSEVYTVGESTIKLMMIRNEGGLVAGNEAPVSVVIKGKYK